MAYCINRPPHKSDPVINCVVTGRDLPNFHNQMSIFAEMTVDGSDYLSAMKRFLNYVYIYWFAI